MYMLRYAMLCYAMLCYAAPGVNGGERVLAKHPGGRPVVLPDTLRRRHVIRDVTPLRAMHQCDTQKCRLQALGAHVLQGRRRAHLGASLTRTVALHRAAPHRCIVLTCSSCRCCQAVRLAVGEPPRRTSLCLHSEPEPSPPRGWSPHGVASS